MATGKVKWYNESKGYGFIETEGGEDVFVHRSGLSISYLGLEPGQKVEFQTKSGQKGLVAFDVKLTN
jgi:CspA family cold shock protein